MRISIIILVLLSVHIITQAQTDAPILQKGYYAVVGTFAIHENASAFNSQLNKEGWKTSYGFLPSRRLYYVYTLLNDDLTVCRQEAKKLRERPQFNDAWVRYIDEEGEEKQIAPEKTAEPVVVSAPVTTVISAPEKEVVVQDNEVIQIPQVSTLQNSEAFLNLYNESNDHVVEGKVQVVDTERGKLIAEVNGNSYISLPDPKSKSGRLTLLCDALGYRKVQHEILYQNPVTDSTREFIDEMGSSLVINFRLLQYHSGDIRPLYNVYFYNDAAVFLPESKFELNQLLAMMKDSPKYRIMLHGHTNGNYHGKIIRIGPSGNFFSVTKDATTTVGSAKELSESRAEAIKKYLIANGIEESRVEVKAWGGKRPLYDKNSANAKKNIRVEVEIIGE